MKTYMLLLYANEQGGLSLPQAEMAKWMAKMGEYADALEKADAFISTGGLGITSEARTVHIDDGELKVHDGPYAETQEQLGGYYLIRARDMDSAQAWAAKCPAALWGHVEIREIDHAS
jgi:hypothetical protein